ncbi:hypothetical protein SEA_BOCK_66 [Gordonia phage Bock]|nr:hypothetical protein SEA_BOCK_66 [Gordonia phage Bock]
MTAPTVDAGADVDLEALFDQVVPCDFAERVPDVPHESAEWLLTVYPCGAGHKIKGPDRHTVCSLCIERVKASIERVTDGTATGRCAYCKRHITRADLAEWRPL